MSDVCPCKTQSHDAGFSGLLSGPCCAVAKVFWGGFRSHCYAAAGWGVQCKSKGLFTVCKVQFRMTRITWKSNNQSVRSVKNSDAKTH